MAAAPLALAGVAPLMLAAVAVSAVGVPPGPLSTAPAAASAKARVAIVAPRAGARVSGVVSGRRCAARVRVRRVRRVVFLLDGRRLRVDRRAPFTCRLDARRLRPGRHVLRAVAHTRAGRRRAARVPITVVARSAPPRALAPILPRAAPTAPEPATPAPYTPIPIAGTTYHVSPSGSDDNPGTSPERAWRTVARANRAPLRPGDGVLFAAGHEFADQALMPSVSGGAGAPIVFGSYGGGRARLPRGVWFRGRHDLVFQELHSGGSRDAGVQGEGSRIVVQGCAFERVQTAVYLEGKDWTVKSNAVVHSADSAMILFGTGHAVAGNVVEHSGEDASLDYGKHGVYLKASGSRVVANVIRRFADSGVSARFRDSVVEHNTIADGQIGISWFQNDAQGGLSTWQRNHISGTTAAGIYVSPRDSAGATRESFAIAHNTIRPAGGSPLDLQPTSGTYAVHDNAVG